MSGSVDTSDFAVIRKLARTFRLNASACDGVVNKHFQMRFSRNDAEALARVLDQGALLTVRKQEYDKAFADFEMAHRGMEIMRARWRAKLAERRGLCLAWFAIGAAADGPLEALVAAIAGLVS